MIISFRDKEIKEEVNLPNNKDDFVTVSNKANIKQGYKKLILNGLENSPEVCQLLVKLHDHNRLYDMAKTDDGESREELVEIMTGLLKHDLSATGHELIADVLLALISKAKQNLRLALSERLSVMQNVPLRIVLKLANDDIEVANPVLKNSKDLTDFDLIYILKAKGVSHGQIIAQRPELSSTLVNMLVSTNDVNVAINLVKNNTIIFNKTNMADLIAMAMQSDDLASPLLKRDEITVELVAKIYETVGEELKTFIKDNFESTNLGVVDSEIDSLVSEFSKLESGILNPTEDLIQKAEYMFKNNMLSPQVIVDSLRRGQISTFVAQMSVCCSLPSHAIERVVKQKSGRDLAAACTLAGIVKSDFINIFLLTSRVRSTNIICESDLSTAIHYFDKMDQRIATSLFHKDRH